MGFFVFILCGICSVSWIYRFVSFAKFREFQPLFFHIPFHFYALLSLRDLGIWIVDICCVALHNIGYLLCRSMKLCSFSFQSIFFLLFIWGNFYWAIKSTAWHTGNLLMNETKKGWVTGLVSIGGPWPWLTMNPVSPVEWWFYIRVLIGYKHKEEGILVAAG